MCFWTRVSYPAEQHLHYNFLKSRLFMEARKGRVCPSASRELHKGLLEGAGPGRKGPRPEHSRMSRPEARPFYWPRLLALPRPEKTAMPEALPCD